MKTDRQGVSPVDWLARISRRMRAKRFARFAALAEALPKPLRILDVGGRAAYWHAHGWANRPDIRIVTGNIEPQTARFSNIEPAHVDATDMSQFADEAFDIVFSNSVIEHLYTWKNQVCMAAEVRRVGKAYWVQTPNYWFPMEPHFRVIGWQWLPVQTRIAILCRHRCGFRGPCIDPHRARQAVQEIRLLSRRHLAHLFPGATIWPEKWWGLTKSWVAHSGFAPTHRAHVP